MMTPTEFLTLLFGHKSLEGLYLNIWDKKSRRSSFFALPDTPGAAENASSRAGTADVYFGTCPYACIPEDGRGTADIAAALVGVWLDVDVQHAAAHASKRLPETREQAFDLLYEMPQDPTLVVSSGYGIQGWWLFQEPFLIRSGADRIEAGQVASGWITAANKRAAKHKWDLDPVGDLARVLRLPGTWNHKVAETPRPVEVVR